MKRIPWRRLGAILGYLVIGVVAFLFFFFMTLPVDQLREWIEFRAAKLVGAPVRIDALEIDGLKGATLLGIHTRIKVPHWDPVGQSSAALPGAGRGRAARATPSPSKWPRVPADLRLDSLRVEVSPFGLLFGNARRLRVAVEAWGGEAATRVTLQPDGAVRAEEGEAKGVRLGRAEPLQAMLPWKLDGRLDGEWTVEWKGALRQSRGSLHVTVHDAVLREPVIEAKNYGKFHLTDVSLGTVEISLWLGPRAEKARLRGLPGVRDATILQFEKLEATGGDVELVVDPASAIVFSGPKRAGRTSLSLQAALSIADEFFNREVTRDGKKEHPNKFIKVLLDSDRRFKAAKRNGWYGLTCTGLLPHPHCTWTRPTMRVGIKRTRLHTGGRSGQGKPGRRDDGGHGGGAGKSPDAGANEDRGGPPAPGRRQGARRPGRLRRPSRRELVIPAEKPVLPERPVSTMSPEERLEQLRKQREERIRALREQRKALYERRAGGRALPVAPAAAGSGEEPLAAQPEADEPLAEEPVEALPEEVPAEGSGVEGEEDLPPDEEAAPGDEDLAPEEPLDHEAPPGDEDLPEEPEEPLP